jgi:hypothetical protein
MMRLARGRGAVFGRWRVRGRWLTCGLDPDQTLSSNRDNFKDERAQIRQSAKIQVNSQC